MKSLVYTAPWTLELVDRDMPEPGPGQVRIKMAATGICGSDFHGFTGSTGRRQPGQIMGHETAGHIDALGDGVEHLAVGDLVTVNPVVTCGTCERCQGELSYMCANKYVIGVRADVPAAFSDYFLAPAVNVVPLTGGATAELGALVEPLSVGLHAAVRGQIEGGAAVLVIGGGPIGQAAALGALARGGRVLVTEPNVARRALLGRLGVPALDPADGADAIRAALGGPADVVIDAVGSSATIAAAVDASDPLARIVLVGMQTPQLEIAAYAFSTMERTLIGSFSYSASEFAATAAYVGAHPELGQLVEARVGWSGAAEAFRQLAAGEAQASKILVMPDLP